VILSRDPVKLELLQLAPKPRVAGLALSTVELPHHFQCFKILLQGVAERDLIEPLVDLWRSLRHLCAN